MPHGLSIGTTMPYVLEYNAPADLEKHSKIASLLGENVEGLPLRDAAFQSAEAFRKLLLDIDLPTTIKDVGVNEDMIPILADNVFKSERHVARNPRRVTKDGMVKLFERAIRGRLASEN